jgi:hypothetical protein
MATSITRPNPSGAAYNNQILAKNHKDATPPSVQLPPPPPKNLLNRWKQLKAGHP